MATPVQSTIEQSLAKILDPVLKKDLVSLEAVENIDIQGGDVSITIVLGYPVAGIRQSLEKEIEESLSSLSGVSKVVARVQALIIGSKAEKSDALYRVKNIIAVASGKGGVGKSTTAVNLALALSVEGARVGILDADIYGPSQPQMLGVGKKEPQIVNNQFMVPIEAHGLKSNSMGYLVTEKTPMVWRGPMASSAFQQLVNQTDWGDLDYLVVDMPPGTGDIQLTLSQSVSVTGAVIVTTPQDIALMDAKKGIEMFRKVNVPVLGIVENMATHTCNNCGHEEHIFGEGGGAAIAKQYQTSLLGSLPLDLSIREHADGGKPSVIADPDSAISQTYRSIARGVAALLWHVNKSQATVPKFEISDD